MTYQESSQADIAPGETEPTPGLAKSALASRPVRTGRDKWPYALILTIMALWSYPVLAGTPALVAESADERLKATYLGGSGEDWPWSVVADQSGSIYISGITGSGNFPTNLELYDRYNAGFDDAFVMRLTDDLTEASYSSFFGGSGRDGAAAIALAADGDVHIYGFTASTDLPVHPEAYDSDYNAKFITGTCDGVIECLSEADVNQSGGANPSCDDITIGDISVLIDYLFITGQELGLPECL